MKNIFITLQQFTISPFYFSQGTKVCDIGDDVKETLRKFRFRKATTNAALISKSFVNLYLFQM